MIKQILRLQDLLWEEVPEELRRELEVEEGSIGVLEVYDEKGREETIFLMFDKGRVTEIPPGSYRHKIRMDIDTFLDLIFEDRDFAEMWACGRVRVEGEDYAIHAIKWSKWFSIVRNLIKKKIFGR
ncbi:MAG: hypothetical protein ACXQTW_03825 [Candidatus Methanospirareceae archaeon]